MFAKIAKGKMMPDWGQILNEIRTAGSTHDIVRRRYIRALHQRTGRNVIVYYSGWLQKRGVEGVEVSDADKDAFMSVIHGLDRKKGLDLVLHTPGGSPAATESIVDYLRAMFGTNIRAVVPQLAMSAGTLIVCACREVLMGKHSSLGPIDPQFGGIPAHGVVEEFERAQREIKADKDKIAVWQPIIARYSPALIGECEKAIEWSNEMAQAWLLSGMFKGKPTDKKKKKVQKIVTELGDHAVTKNHGRHLSLKRCKQIGLKTAELEKDQDLQDAVLSAHHACVHTLSATPAIKIIENHNGSAFIQMAQNVVLKQR